MKLRTVLFASALVAATGASALTTTNTFARMPVTATLQNTLLAIPLAGCGEASAKIYVTNLVMTTGLAAETKLLYKDGGNWYAWKLATVGGEWQQMAESTEWGTTISPAAGSTALPCGRGCWLVFPEAASTTVYLYGQVNEGAVLTTVVGGSGSQLTYTILSYPYETGSINLNSWEPKNAENENVAETGDTVTVASAGGAGQKTYMYVSGTGWTYKVTTPSATWGEPPTTEQVKVPASGDNSVVISAGTAFIYGRKDTADATIKWTR